MTFSYLALGDSYTIGEQLPLHQNFPYQAIQMLRSEGEGQAWQAPEILAKTGWTTDELMDAMSGYTFCPRYDFVSLLIGVNNQYRGRPVDQYQDEFTQLLLKAIQLAGGQTDRVAVLSIPDWGITPFAEGRDKGKIEKEIDQYNEACSRICEQQAIHFTDITSVQRAHGNLPEWLAADGLHPSAAEYTLWATALSRRMRQVISGYPLR